MLHVQRLTGCAYLRTHRDTHSVEISLASTLEHEHVV